MADGTKIEWTDATWNPITGCSVVSPGCTNCYAMRLAGTRLKHHPSRVGLTRDTKAGPVWTGEVRFNPQWLDEPLRWKKPRMIFVCAHGDLFAEGVPDEWIDQVFAVMALAPQHTFQVLTKRPQRMRDYLRHGGVLDRLVSAACRIDSPDGASWAADIHSGHVRGLPLPNVWLGVSVEDQKRAVERIPILLETPAAVRWISVEPILGPIDLTRIDQPNDGFGPYWINALTAGEAGWFADEAATIRTEADPLAFSGLARLDWVVAGGESGTGARPMHPDWARALRDQCSAAGVPFLFKQWGNWATAIDRDKDDPDWRADYRNKFSDSRDNIAWLNIAGGRGFHGERFHIMRRTTKSNTGRLLDGVEHSEFPEIRA